MNAAEILKNARLYGIVDLGYVRPEGIPQATEALCQGGIDLIQLRAKNQPMEAIESWARQMLPITRRHGVPLILNDHPTVARAVGCEGVHVGQEDDSVARAREIVGPGILVGKSTHSLAQAVAARAEGPDYIGYGPLYATGTKPDYPPIGLADIAAVHQQVQLPIFCIGGVNQARISEIVAAGARRVVAVSALLLAEDISWAVRQLRAALP
jgi:thiamine-phosphate pyrophosphorylase